MQHEVVHVWRIGLEHPLLSGAACERVLAADELARAARFVLDRDRRQYVVSRGMLRIVLARYLGTQPRDLEFVYGARGKPSLGQPRAADWLRFNVAHSGNLALFGVSRQREIGIDIEHVRPLEGAAAIAEQFFSPGERELLRQAPRRAALERFFTYWVRKEAVIKATGDGLSLPLDRFDVSWLSTESPRSVVVEDGSHALHRLRVVDLQAGAQCSAALAAEGEGWSVEYHDVSELGADARN